MQSSLTLIVAKSNCWQAKAFRRITVVRSTGLELGHGSPVLQVTSASGITQAAEAPLPLGY
jgi:hypothetical protein